MNVSVLLAVVFILALPPALALNCTLFSGKDHELCTVVDVLTVDESYKDNLMRSDLYGSVSSTTDPISLQVGSQDTPPVTLEQMYDEKLAFCVKFALFVFFNYIVFSFLTKSRRFQRWLTADY
jgi:hypothetical protein